MRLAADVSRRNFGLVRCLTHAETVHKALSPTRNVLTASSHKHDRKEQRPHQPYHDPLQRPLAVPFEIGVIVRAQLNALGPPPPSRGGRTTPT